MSAAPVRSGLPVFLKYGEDGEFRDCGHGGTNDCLFRAMIAQLAGPALGGPEGVKCTVALRAATFLNLVLEYVGLQHRMWSTVDGAVEDGDVNYRHAGLIAAVF